jgi:hypothetical protein
MLEPLRPITPWRRRIPTWGIVLIVLGSIGTLFMLVALVGVLSLEAY